VAARAAGDTELACNQSHACVVYVTYATVAVHKLLWLAQLVRCAASDLMTRETRGRCITFVIRRVVEEEGFVAMDATC
jgi:hypothetical protein